MNQLGGDGSGARAPAGAGRPGAFHPGLTVGELMTRQVVTLGVDQDLGLAAEIMTLGRLRHLPVVDGAGRLVGLVTHRDLLRALADALRPFTPDENRWFGVGRVERTVPVSAIMTRDVRVVGPGAAAAEAAIIMRDGKHGCVPVVGPGGALAGIVTEANYLGLAIEALSGAGGGAEGETP